MHEHLSTIIKLSIPRFSNKIANSSRGPESAPAVHKSRNRCSKFPSSLIPQQNKATRIVMPAWYKATQEDKDNFTMDLYSRLAALETPDSLLCRNSCCQNRNHSEERDSHVLDILIAVIESSHTCIPSSGGGRVTADPRKACKVSQSVLGWQEHVKPFREDSVF